MQFIKNHGLRWLIYGIWASSFLAMGCYGVFIPVGTPWACAIGKYHPLGTCTSPYGQELPPEKRVYWRLQFGFEMPEEDRHYNLDWSAKQKVSGSHYRQLVFHWTLRIPGRDYETRIRKVFCTSETFREAFDLDDSLKRMIVRLISPDPQTYRFRKVTFTCE